jgi:hypothetical protein
LINNNNIIIRNKLKYEKINIKKYCSFNIVTFIKYNKT